MKITESPDTSAVGDSFDAGGVFPSCKFKPGDRTCMNWVLSTR